MEKNKKWFQKGKKGDKETKGWKQMMNEQPYSVFP